MDYEKDFENLYLDTSYGKVHYMHHPGASTSIILIHGLASSTRTWGRLVGYLPDDLNIYLVDLLGHGESEAPDIEYTVHVQVEIIKKIIEQSGLDDFYLFGHSYGGWVSLVYAKENNAKGIIIEDSAGLEQFYDEVKGLETRKKYKEDLLKKALTLGAREHVIEGILDEEFTEGQLEEKDLKLIRVPTLIIWGSDDNIVDLKFSKIFQKEIEGSTLSIVEGAKHTPHYTNPKEVSELLLQFIKK